MGNGLLVKALTPALGTQHAWAALWNTSALMQAGEQTGGTRSLCALTWLQCCKGRIQALQEAQEGLSRDLFPVKEPLELMELCLGMGAPVTDLLITQQHSDNTASECINDNFPTWGTKKERCSAGPHTYKHQRTGQRRGSQRQPGLQEPCDDDLQDLEEGPRQ